MMTPTVLEVNKFSYVYAGEALDKANNSFVTITPNSHVFASAVQDRKSTFYLCRAQLYGTYL